MLIENLVNILVLLRTSQHFSARLCPSPEIFDFPLKSNRKLTISSQAGPRPTNVNYLLDLNKKTMISSQLGPNPTNDKFPFKS